VCRTFWNLNDENCCEHLFQDLHQSKQNASVKPPRIGGKSFLASNERKLYDFSGSNQLLTMLLKNHKHAHLEHLAGRRLENITDGICFSVSFGWHRLLLSKYHQHAMPLSTYFHLNANLQYYQWNTMGLFVFCFMFLGLLYSCREMYFPALSLVSVNKFRFPESFFGSQRIQGLNESLKKLRHSVFFNIHQFDVIRYSTQLYGSWNFHQTFINFGALNVAQGRHRSTTKTRKCDRAKLQATSSVLLPEEWTQRKYASYWMESNAELQLQ